NFNLAGAPLNKSTSGTLILGGNNSTYKGAMNINGGTLQIGAGGNSGTPSTATVPLTVASGATLAFNRSDTSLTVGNKITGAGNVENKGSGTVTISGSNNDYTGGTTATAGRLKLGSPGALPAGGNFVFNGGILELNNQDVTSSRTLGILTL